MKFPSFALENGEWHFQHIWIAVKNEPWQASFLLQFAHETLLQYGSTDLQALLQITGEGGAWSNSVLTSLLTGQHTSAEEGQFSRVNQVLGWQLLTSLSKVIDIPTFFVASGSFNQLGGRRLHGNAGQTSGEDGRNSQGGGAGQSVHWMQLHLQPGYISSNLRLPALSSTP